jgi:Putative metallopeptidase
MEPMPKTKAIWLFAAALSLAAGAVAMAQTNTQPTAGQSSQPHIPKNPNIVISYEPPTNPLYQEVYNDLKARHVLEELQHFLAFIHYPRPLSVKLTTCGEANSWYDSHLQGVELCYEIVDWIRRVAPTQPQVGNLTREDAIVGPIVQVILHEFGHATFDQLEVPIAGREEDAADQFSAYMMLLAGKDMAHRTLPGAGYFWAATNSPYSRIEYSDVHGEPLQRSYNLLCMAYGAYPDEFQYLVDAELLPKARAALCAHDYKLVARAFDKTVGPHVDQDMLKLEQTRQWLRPNELQPLE